MSVAKALRPFQDLRSPWILIASPNFDAVARRLVAAMPPDTMEYLEITWSHFPDTTPRIVLSAEAVEGRDVLLLADIPMNDLLSYFSVVYAVPRYFARTFLVVTPFFPTGTMERVEREGEIATAMTLARMMNATPSPSVGATTFMHFDIHALATRFFFSDAIKPWLTTAVPLISAVLEREFAAEKNESKKPVVLAFPDEGAQKRFKVLFGQGFDMCTCSKVRVGDRRVVTLQEGDPSGRDVVIIDDMVQSGGTMLECAKLLKERGAVTVSCYVTHGVFPNDSWRRFTNETMERDGASPLRAFYLTDSIPTTAAKVEGHPPFKVLSIASRLADLLTEVPPSMSPTTSRAGTAASM